MSLMVSQLESAVESLPLGKHLDPSQKLDGAAISDCCDWLSFHRVWGMLADEVLQAIAQSFYSFDVEPEADIYRQGQSAMGLYFLKWGSIEIYRQSPVGRTHMRYRSAGEIFGYTPLVSAAAVPHYPASALALTKSAIWLLKREDFERLVRDYPTIQAPINQLLAQDLAQFSQRIAWEQTRIQGLQRYLQPVPRNAPLLGQSKAAVKVEKLIQITASHTKPVALQGAAGTGKSFVSGYIHAHSGLKQHPFAELDCAQLPRDQAGVIQSDLLFGAGERGGDQEQVGLLELLERGTLLIDNVQLLTMGDRERLSHYLETGYFRRNPLPGAPGAGDLTNPAPSSQTSAVEIKSWVRLILASPKAKVFPSLNAHSIKLFSLFQRKDDIPEFSRYFLAQACQEQGRLPLQLSQSDLRRLISYAYPGNLTELRNIVYRAVIMTPAEQSVISEQVLWSMESKTNAFRIDLLDQLPWLRQFLLSQWWPQGFWVIMMAFFIPVTVLGFWGPQTRDSSMTLNFFWAWWWPFYLLLFPLVGRLWCAVCPFMITAEWLRQLSLWIWPRDLLPWPTQWMNRWGAWLLFAGFGVIYLWEHLWDLPHSAALSAWLLLAITAGAVIFSLIYERRLWCRYLCPIGGMNGMFAKLSLVEVRSTQQVCGSQCSSFGCYKGSPATAVSFADALPREGQATEGCPLYSHPAQLQDNRDCVLCMTCLKACPNRSVQVNLRFPASDLLENHREFWAEAALLLLLLGGVFMHHDLQILAWFGWENWIIDSEHLGLGIPVVILLLSAPALFIGLVHGLSRQIDPQMPRFLTLIYAYLPLTLVTNLAHYIPAAVTEAGQILPVTARTLGFHDLNLPTLTASPDVAAFLQGTALLAGLLFSLYPLLRISQRPWLSTLPHVLAMATLTLVCAQLMF